MKGEVTLVLGPSEPEPPSLDEAVAAARALVADGQSVSDSARSASELTGVSRREIYEALLVDTP